MHAVLVSGFSNNYNDDDSDDSYKDSDCEREGQNEDDVKLV